jgi:hypothetical protein
MLEVPVLQESPIKPKKRKHHRKKNEEEEK